MAGIYEAIKTERDRQVSKGFDAAHDDQHGDGAILASVGRIILDASRDRGDMGRPFDCALRARFKNTFKERLVKAAAMLVAELERMERLEGPAPADELVIESTKRHWAYSDNEEYDYEGTFETRDEAIREAIKQGCLDTFWVGVCEPPAQPETYFDAEEFFERVSEDDDYCGEHADGWLTATPEQKLELNAAVATVIGQWLDRHKLRPKFFTVVEYERLMVDASGQAVPFVAKS